MLNLYDIAYGSFVAVTSPVWLLRGRSRRKVVRAFKERMGHLQALSVTGPKVLIHAVSLGEMNATSTLVKVLQARQPGLHVVVSTTTETGFDRGRQLYGNAPGVTLIHFPLDFTAAINRVLDAVQPSVVALMELEIWPNFLLQCHRRNIPVVLLNGRITSTAFDRYKLARPVTARMLKRIAALCVQEDSYADRFKELGAPPDRVQVTGTMKFDTAQISDRVDGDTQLALDLGLLPPLAEGANPGPTSANGESSPLVPWLTPGAKLWVCGSTGPGEEAIILRTYRKLVTTFPDLRLAIIPRHPQRFDEVANLITSAGFPLLRRSTASPANISGTPVILGDTMGELRKFYSLATVVFSGRSLVDLGPRQHGSDMIEPAALAKPVIVGTFTNNFAEAARKLKEVDGIAEVHDELELARKLSDWMTDPAKAGEIGRRAQNIVRQNQGATAKHVEVVLSSVRK